MRHTNIKNYNKQHETQHFKAYIKQSILSLTVFIAHQQSVTLLMGILLLFFINTHVETRFFLWDRHIHIVTWVQTTSCFGFDVVKKLRSQFRVSRLLQKPQEFLKHFLVTVGMC